MHFPDYHGGSIVNLMSSIADALRGRLKCRYPQLRILPSREISSRIALIVIDGLGYAYLQQHGKGTVFQRCLKGSMTSVFPSTTAAAIPMFATGLPPQQHGITGWYMFLREYGLVSAVLPFVVRGSGQPVGDRESIFTAPSFSSQMPVRSAAVVHKDIASSPVAQGACREMPYASLNGFFQQIQNALQGRKQYVYAYWPRFDKLCHLYGTESIQAKRHFAALEKGMCRFLKTVPKGVTVIITADHGLIDTVPSRRIIVNKHPALHRTLVLPLAGEPRLAYCYVRPGREQEFLQYVRTHLSHACTVHRSADLIKQDRFGLFKPHPALADRVGDYTLIMKENYVINDILTGEKKHYFIGNHGGVSREEMLVPLIIFHSQ